jgi:hypothetical protein
MKRQCGNCRRISIRLNDKYQVKTYCWHKGKFVQSITPACKSNDDYQEIMGGAGVVKSASWSMPQPIRTSGTEGIN